MGIKVSVIIPAYNTETYIFQAIQSVLEQTEKNIEVIVVDDASTDRTLEVVKTFIDKRVKVFVNKQNYGRSYSLNIGFKEAQGKWLAILDSDDWFVQERLEQLLLIGDAEDADMMADNLYLIRDGDSKPWSTFLAESRVSINKIKHIKPLFFIENDLPGQWSIPLGLTKPIIKRDFLIKHQIKVHQDIRVGEDFYLDTICLAHGARFIFVPKPYYFYRSRQGSLVTESKINLLNEYCQATRYLLDNDLIKKNPDLEIALSKRIYLMEKIRPYFHVIDSIEEGRLLKIVMAMIYNPYFFVHLVRELPRIILRRLHYYLPKKIIN
jgi:succinoglycan biosynthesis protein ExoO